MWNDLSIADKAKFILVGVLNGIYNIDAIRQAYDSVLSEGNLFKEGGNIKLSTNVSDWLSPGETSIGIYSPDGKTHTTFSGPNFIQKALNYVNSFGINYTTIGIGDAARLARPKRIVTNEDENHPYPLNNFELIKYRDSKSKPIPLSAPTAEELFQMPTIKYPDAGEYNFGNSALNLNYNLQGITTQEVIHNNYTIANDYDVYIPPLYKRHWLDKYAGANYSPAYTEALHNFSVDDYVRNHNRVVLSNPNYFLNWDMANNIFEFLNVGTGGLLNRMSPTLNARLIYDLVTGENVNPFDYNSSYWGNSGIVSDKYAQEHPYLTFGINFLGDAALGAAGIKGVNKGINAGKNYIISRKINRMPLVRNSETPPPNSYHNLFRLGDVEINNPMLNYRQLQRGGADNFVSKGSLYAPDYINHAAQKGEITLHKGLFPNPMYKRGSLWYGEPTPTSSTTDLLVTAEPMQVANKYARPVRGANPNDISIQGGRRIPVDNGRINLTNTSAYYYDPNWGYRRAVPFNERVKMLFYQRPSKLTASERAGIPKGERNNNSSIRELSINSPIFKKSAEFFENEIFPIIKWNNPEAVNPFHSFSRITLRNDLPENVLGNYGINFDEAIEGINLVELSPKALLRNGISMERGLLHELGSHGTDRFIPYESLSKYVFDPEVKLPWNEFRSTLMEYKYLYPDWELHSGEQILNNLNALNGYGRKVYQNQYKWKAFNPDYLPDFGLFEEAFKSAMRPVNP